ncbi:MAG: 23S rRNA (adenine(2503)-C(2))-methyltransferase RlmN, partial [Clostridia bacterium]|nr:23S rRNA (adenine(2503)-C(2))-methyltransferase RlmN [Clostridia bacterium]
MYLSDMTREELTELLEGWGEPRYRAEQVFTWLSGCTPIDGMLNLPRRLRDRLKSIPYGAVEIAERRVSKKDGTVKYLFRLEDQNLVEGVLMRYHYGNTLCLSTQVGCRMGCAFCASTLDGCVRNLSAGEMLGQVAAVNREAAEEGSQRRGVTNLVLMGSGEPLDNYDNVLRFLRLVSSPGGLCISPRNISLSTCGLVPMIDRLMQDAPHVTLSVSLHAHSDEQRTRIMPVNRRYPIGELLAAARRYADVTGMRVEFENSLIRGFNAAREDAHSQEGRLSGMR